MRAGKDDEYDKNDQIASIHEQQPLVLPDVPEDNADDAFEASASVPDIADIERKLAKLKFFSEAWFQPTSAVANNAEPSSNNLVTEEIVAVVSTEADRKAFNQWYYNRVNMGITKVVHVSITSG